MNPRETARHHVGFLYFNPSLSIDRLGYDSNVLNSSSEPKADFTASITPQATIWIPFQRRALLTTDASVGFVYYKAFKSQRTVNGRINTLGELYARRLTFSVEAGTSTDFRQPNVEIERRVKQSTDTFGGGVRFTMLRGLSVGVSAYRQTGRFDDDESIEGINLSGRLDRVEQGLRFIMLERLTSLTTVGLIVETRKDQFDRSSERDADGYRVAGTIALAEKALISGTAEIGYRHVKPTDAQVPAFSGLVTKVGLTNRIAGSFEATLGWDRDMQYSINESRPFYLTNAVSVTLRRQVAGQFDTSVGATRNRATYQSLSGAVVEGNRELLTTYTADIGYRFNRTSRLALGVTHNKRSSTLADSRRYSNTLAGLSLNYAF